VSLSNYDIHVYHSADSIVQPAIIHDFPFYLEFLNSPKRKGPVSIGEQALVSESANLSIRKVAVP
jgi:hypothetical protein|tara:strand:- start:2758 stop:2952 length:195 start_codon:yes stop_codon:yes gene_type:complete